MMTSALLRDIIANCDRIAADAAAIGDRNTSTSASEAANTARRMLAVMEAAK